MDGSNRTQEPRKAVVVSLTELKQSTVPFEKIEEAFGPSSLGILVVKDLPARFLDLRLKLLSYASYLANLPPEELGKYAFYSQHPLGVSVQITCSKLSRLFSLDNLSCPSAKYLSGWSHGKEALKSGSYDTLKGSYYVNCAFYQGKGMTVAPSTNFPEFTAPNVWPAKESLPGFQEIFEELCTLIIDTAVLVARACDRYATAHIEDYEAGYLEHVVKTSTTTKARLLHYFPPGPFANHGGTYVEPRNPSDNDSWCATHVDHGCLTGLISALYVDESAHPVRLNNLNTSEQPPILPSLASPPDPDTGLYIHARDSTVTKVSIPHDCLGFQTGEALQVITGGKFRAVPHFVRAGGGLKGCAKVARNTLAVFTQPGLDGVVDRERGTTFGEFSREVVGRFS